MFLRRTRLLGLLAAACVSVSAFAQGEIRIAHVLSLTGPLEAYGKQTAIGFMMGLDYATGGTMTVAGKKLVVIEKDDQGKPDLGKNLLAAAYGDDKVDIAVGPTASPVALAMLPVADMLPVMQRLRQFEKDRIYDDFKDQGGTVNPRDRFTGGSGKNAGRLTGSIRALDPVTGEMLAFGYSAIPPYLRAYVIGPDGTFRRTIDIDLPAPVMMHDFAITERHLVFLDAPVVFDVHAIASGGPMVRWEPSTGTRIGVLPRGADGSQVKWFDIDNSYVVHFFNAWEHGSTIEIRAPRMPDMPGGFKFENPDAARPPLPWRWSIDLATGKVSEGPFGDTSSEFPRVAESLTGRPTRYGYACPQRSWEFEFDFEGVYKYDFHTDNVEAHMYSSTQVCGEHVFAPDPNGTSEDDGWLLSFVTMSPGVRAGAASPNQPLTS